MKAMDLIRAERQRQIEAEGWTPAHDDEHEPGILLRAAVVYLWHGTEKAAPIGPDGTPVGWPWEPKWWKPRDRRSNLIRAGALALAEKDAIERRYFARVAMEDLSIPRRITLRAPNRTVAAYTGHVEHKLEIIVRELEALGAPDDRADDRAA